MVNLHNHRHAELFDVFNVTQQIGTAFFNRLYILIAQLMLVEPYSHLQCPDGGHQNHTFRQEAGFTAFNVKEASAQICPKPASVTT